VIERKRKVDGKYAALHSARRAQVELGEGDRVGADGCLLSDGVDAARHLQSL
jgi:hypothetical protein